MRSRSAGSLPQASSSQLDRWPAGRSMQKQNRSCSESAAWIGMASAGSGAVRGQHSRGTCGHVVVEPGSGIDPVPFDGRQ